MNIKLFKLCCKSLKRRWRQIARACTATFLAVFFITGVLIFEENMYQWQMACNKDRFGDWFVLAVTRGEPDEKLSSHMFLESPGKALISASIYDDKWEDTKLRIGYMTEEFKKLGRIKAEKGRFPEADDEVAMDYNTLASLGYSFEPGQTITINYYMDNKSGEKNKRTVEYKLVGVLRNYTSTWRAGENVPSAVMTEEAVNQVECYRLATYIYPLKNSIKTDDYKLIYKNLVEGVVNTVAYNENVYNYEPWGSKLVYNYMYILVMFIGIAALTYQVIGYRNSRREFNHRIYCMGASRRQIRYIGFMENMLILVPFGILGVGVANLAGRLISYAVEQNMEIAFYQFNREILIKAVISIIAAIVVEEIVNLVTEFGKRRKAVTRRKSNKKVTDSRSGRERDKTGYSGSILTKARLTPKSFNVQVHRRLCYSGGKLAMIGVRAFSVGVLAVIVICIFNIYTAVQANRANEKIPDLIGYKEMDIGEFKHFFRKSSRVWDIAEVSSSIYNKQGNTNLTQGFTEEMLENIKGVNGVAGVECSYFETQRRWTWDGMSYEKMCLDKLSVKKKSGVSGKKGYGDRYLFATEYVDPTEELYKKISKYIDDEYVDYEAFKRGEQVLILVNDNANGNNEFDDTIKPGKRINYHYYTVPASSDTGSLINNVDSFPYNIGVLELGQGKLFDIEWFGGKVGSGIHMAGVKSTPEMERVDVEAAVEPTVAGVVYLTDDIKSEIQEEFKDIVPSFDYYTAIASSEMAAEACTRQNKMVADYLQMDDIPEEMKCYPVYNQLAIYYDLSSAYSATANIVSVYCKENNVNYVSHAEEKAVLRTRTINAILQYGITMLAAIVVNVLLSAILVKNRIEARIQRLRLLVRLGTDYKRLCHICMLESLTESFWCIFTAPLVIMVSYVIYRRNLKKLYMGILA